ncbi:hypothetical protein CASFOL_011472 [Castilleja foliolosa]|uniref:Uncharacterized protein n=1 Tax=Castilleja foliolosa TaxID=1961234 RepID=A0ABD3DXH7_9LAMI
MASSLFDGVMEFPAWVNGDESCVSDVCGGHGRLGACVQLNLQLQLKDDFIAVIKNAMIS